MTSSSSKNQRADSKDAVITGSVARRVSFDVALCTFFGEITLARSASFDVALFFEPKPRISRGNSM
jgi:hypothetical protein